MSDIERLVAEAKWAQARTRIQEELVFHPTDHWLWLTLSLTYYEDKDYAKALECSQRALQLEPACPLALWHYAGSLYMTGQETAALTMWAMLLARDVEEVAYGEHGEGLDWALQLLNDVHYRMGRCYAFLGEKEQARASFRKYLHNRQHGVTSLYDAKEAEKELAAVS
jgi:tetratricopeptide (TPR) repeat protein